MAEQLRDQLKTAIDLRLQKGAQKSDFGVFLFSPTLLYEWYESTNIPGAYKDYAIARVCLEVTHEKKSEKKIPLLGKIVPDKPEYIGIRLGVSPEGSEINRFFRPAHRLTLNPHQEPYLGNIIRIGDTEYRNGAAARDIDLEYFLKFVQASKALVFGALLPRIQ